MKYGSLLLLCGISLTAMLGCDTQAPSKPESHTHANGKTHSHDDDHDHDHGDGHTHDHDHAHGAGPHGGTVTDWGGGAYHIEFTVDHEKQAATVYVLGSDEKTPSPIKTDKISLVINDPETEIELVASPLDGETADNASRFTGTHETLGIVREFSGTIQGLVDGTPYTGDFSEAAHGDDHKH